MIIADNGFLPLWQNFEHDKGIPGGQGLGFALPLGQ